VDPVPFFVIAADNERMHLCPGYSDMSGARQCITDEAVEFFDVRGFRLLPVLDQGWTVAGLRPAGPPDEDAVRDRVVAVVQRLLVAFDKQREQAPESEPNLPQPQDLAGVTLERCYRLLADAGLEHEDLMVLVDKRMGGRHSLWSDFWHRVFGC
jgi:hypothetical protein